MAQCRGESHRFESRGTSLHYRRWSTGRGPVVVLVHGFRGHTHWWDWIAPPLADEFDVVALDLSGMGESGRRKRYDRKTFALDILDFVDHLDSPLTVVGHSFGGSSLLLACALDHAAGRKPRIGHSIVIDSWMRFPVDPPYPRGQLGRGRTFGSFEEARERFRLVPPQPVADVAMLDHLAACSVREVSGSWVWKFDPEIQEIPPLRDGRTILRRVMTPTDIVFGESSLTVNRDRAERCVKVLPCGYGPIGIPAANHHMMFDQPVALVATLRALLHARRDITAGPKPRAPRSRPRASRPPRSSRR